jgi:hypothetical protein
VANYDTKEMIKMADELAKHDVPLSVCQCEYSIDALGDSGYIARMDRTVNEIDVDVV